MPRGVYVRTAETRASIAAARRGTRASATTRQTLSAVARRHATDPTWRDRVSRGTREAMQRPDVQQRHRGAIRCALDTRGISSFFNGGQGQPANALTRWYAELLCPLGYIQEHIIQWGGRGQRYRLDFALLNSKINIEIDGSSHKSRRVHDENRDAILRSLGWRVVRVRHV